MEDKVLTIEQMLHLESLGADISDAGMGYFLYGDDGYGDEKYWHLETFDGGDWGSREESVPAYTLEDIIMHMPRIDYYLPFSIQMCMTHRLPSKTEWMAVYESFERVDPTEATNDDWIAFRDESPLQAAYRMYEFLLMKFGKIDRDRWYEMK